MVNNPSGNTNTRTKNESSSFNIAGNKNNANNSVRRNKYQKSIYKKDLEKQQLNKNNIQKMNQSHARNAGGTVQKMNGVRSANESHRANQVRHANQTRAQNAYAPVHKDIRGTASAGVRGQNVRNMNAAPSNSNVRNINNTYVPSGRTRTSANGAVAGRAKSIYSADEAVRGKRVNGQHTSDKIRSSDKRSKNYLTGNDITTRIRKKIADGRLYADEVFKQLFFFKSAEHSRTITREKKKAAMPLKILCAITVCLIFIITWILSGMKLNENAIIISTTEADIAELQRQIKLDEIMLEEKNDLSYIENAAVNDLGMIKKELLPIRYISIGRGDEVELTNAQNVDYIKVTIDALKDIFDPLK